MADFNVDLLHQALQTMYSNAAAPVKKEATTYLENFQKSQVAWNLTHDILSNASSEHLSIFAAQTLRSKITYDFSQLNDNQDALHGLKNSVLQLMLKYNGSSSSDKLVRTQLAILLAQLALQYLAWQGAMDEIMALFLADSATVPCLLEFLKVLPEELNDVKKTSLTDAEFNSRTQDLITNKVGGVIELLSKLTEEPRYHSLVLDCLNSWIKECPIEDILHVTTLTNLIFQSLLNDDTFDKSIECLCTILRETRDIDNYQLIDALYQKVLELHQYMKQSGKFDDIEVFTGLTRLYVEAGESWHVLIARNPEHFKPLVAILLECCENEDDLDVVKYTFYFWYLLKQLVTLPKFETSKAHFVDIYSKLISIIIKHLTYPISSSGDLFNGDKEQEDKFKDFRYEMGDVLKDCCAVVGPTKALSIPFEQIQSFINQNNSQWQYLEAPLFSMRAMAKEVPVREKNMLPVIMNFLIQLPEHPKVRYAATLVLGRYTEWTSQHPDFLEPQLNYIIKGFEIAGNDKEIVIAASHALMYFCQDCSTLLVSYLEQLYMLYGQVQSQLDIDSTYKLVDGLAHVLKKTPRESMYKTTRMFIKPTLDNLAKLVEQPESEENNIRIGDQVEVLTTFVGVLKCSNFEAPDYPINDLFVAEIWPVVPTILNKFGASLKVSERVLKLVKSAVQSFSTYLSPILDQVVNILHRGFQQTTFGCYLWVSGVIVREFGDEYSLEDIKEEIYKFALTQSSAFFDIVRSRASNNSIKEIPDVVEDFFRMANDVLMFYPFKVVPNVELLKSLKDASMITLSKVEEIEPLISTLHFLIDLISWGFPYPPISFFDDNPVHIQQTIQNFLVLDNNGGELIKVLVDGLIFRFHNDIQQDANDLLLKILTVAPDSNLALRWLTEVASALPNVNQKEVEKLMKVISVALPNKDNRRIRAGLKDFVNWYTRKNVNRLE